MADYEQEKGHKTTVDPHLYANDPDEEVGVTKHGGALKKDLKSRHMQMIAIGRLLMNSLSPVRLSLIL